MAAMPVTLSRGETTIADLTLNDDNEIQLGRADFVRKRKMRTEDLDVPRKLASLRYEMTLMVKNIHDKATLKVQTGDATVALKRKRR